MFDKEYSFRGRHAERVKLLTAKFGKSNSQVFVRNFDVYLNAALVGFAYQRKADLDKSSGDETSKIFADILIKGQNDLWFNYRLIMLLDNEYEPDFEKRVDKAFRIFGKEEAKPDEGLFESYVRGGVDILYEKLIEGDEDYLAKLYDFVEDFDLRHNSAVSSEEMQDLLALARGRT